MSQDNWMLLELDIEGLPRVCPVVSRFIVKRSVQDAFEVKVIFDK